MIHSFRWRRTEWVSFEEPLSKGEMSVCCRNLSGNLEGQTSNDAE